MSRHAVVIGLGRSGCAAARALTAEGWRVTAVEDVVTAAGWPTRRAEVLATGADVVESPPAGAWPGLVGSADLVVPSPGVPPTHPGVVAARAARRSVRGEVDLAAERWSGALVAVTGTNGKSTVTELVVAMLLASEVDAVAAGNIGRPLLEVVASSAPGAVVVAEVSSFQLATTTGAFAPQVAVVLGIAADHLDWHGSVEAYVAAKAAIVAHQEPADLVVYDADDPVATRVACSGRARRVPCSIRSESASGYRIDTGALVDDVGERLVDIAALPRALPHDLTDALTAAAAARGVGATRAGVRRALAGFAGLPHRVVTVGDAGGVRWIDDSKATNPHAALHAVESFDSVVLLAGGRNKGLDLGVLADAAPRVRHVIAFGEAGPEVGRAFAGVRPVSIVPGVAEAVKAAAAVARPGDVVLLSPGCASFDAYEGYGARGDHFATEVAAVLRGDPSIAAIADAEAGA